MKKIIFIASLVLSLGIFVLSCSEDESVIQGSPTITGFEPASGPAGSEIVISGQNFSDVSAATTVRIGDAIANIISVSEAEIRVVVPKGFHNGSVSVTTNGGTFTGGSFSTTSKPGDNNDGLVLSQTELLLYPYPHYAKKLHVITEVPDPVVWTSSNENVATVDQQGNVVPLTIGTAIITATAGNLTGECEITVVDGPVTKLSLDRTKLNLHTGEEDMLAITSLKAVVSDPGNPVWSSDNEDVATVDQLGNVIAIGEGVTNVTVTVDNASASCKVTVSPNIYAAGYQNNGIRDVAVLWKNGTMQQLGTGATRSFARAVHVTGNNDVYVVGVEVENGIGIARLWINGVPNDISDGSNSATALSLFVDGTDIYVGGYEIVNGVVEGRVWVNGVAYDYSDGVYESMVASIFVDQGTIYAAGHEDSQNGFKVSFWENGQKTHLEDGRANTVFVSGNDVYVGGFQQLNWPYPQVWVNGQATNQFGEVHNGGGYSVQIVNNHSYVSGIVNSSAVFSKDGGPYINLPNGGNSPSTANSVFVKGDDEYIVGNLWINQVSVPVLWKNGVLIDDYFDHLNPHDANVFGDRCLFVK
jgi:hypothetical protein